MLRFCILFALLMQYAASFNSFFIFKGLRHHIVKRNLQMMSESAPEVSDVISRPIILFEGAVLISSLMFVDPIIVHAAEVAESTAIIPIVRPVIDTFVNVLSFMFICRTVLSWYPKTDIKQFPYSLAVWPTEPLLQPVRDLVPPAFGVDVSAIVWIMLLSFFREILTGQQGILTLIERGG